jgi:2-(1,2-epoxy-1,2-dihydrophenyl)acetyl-CoA isomerase
MESGERTAVLRLELVDPDGPGALDGVRVRAARAELVRLATDRQRGLPSPAAVLIAHPGPNFCVGGDVGGFAAADDPGSFVAAAAAELHSLVRVLVGCPVPVISAVRGWAAGAGLSIVAVSDLVLASDRARFRPAYPGIGFSPDGGMTWTLPRAVGRARALDILLRNRVLDAQQAVAAGLVSEVVAYADLLAAAVRVAEELAAGPGAAYGEIKALVAAGAEAGFDEQLDAEAAAIARCAAGPEGREGVAAFVARRPPRFDRVNQVQVRR